MRSCWKENPKCRPTFTELRSQMDDLLSTVTSMKYLKMSDLKSNDFQTKILPGEESNSFNEEK